MLAKSCLGEQAVGDVGRAVRERDEPRPAIGQSPHAFVDVGMDAQSLESRHDVPDGRVEVVGHLHAGEQVLQGDLCDRGEPLAPSGGRQREPVSKDGGEPHGRERPRSPDVGEAAFER